MIVTKKGAYLGEIDDAGKPQGVFGKVGKVIGCQVLKLIPGFLLKSQITVN